MNHSTGPGDSVLERQMFRLATGLSHKMSRGICWRGVRSIVKELSFKFERSSFIAQRSIDFTSVEADTILSC
jgi:hypothetical protein